MKKQLFYSFILLLCYSSFSQDYFPFQIGLKNQYNAIDTATDTLIYILQSEIISDTIINGKQYFSEQINKIKNNQVINSNINVYFSENNDVYSTHLTEITRYSKYAQHNYSDGDFWSDSFGFYTIKYLSSITIYDKIYYNCYKMESSSGSYCVFADGIGRILVKEPGRLYKRISDSKLIRNKQCKILHNKLILTNKNINLLGRCINKRIKDIVITRKGFKLIIH
jgi:hypothetical protein